MKMFLFHVSNATKLISYATCLIYVAFNLLEIFLLILPLEWWVDEKHYAKINDYVMAVVCIIPLAVVAV
jgi:hypothetical protein